MTITRTLPFELSTNELKTLLGEYNTHLKYLQERLEVAIIQRGDSFIITGDLTAVERCQIVLEKLCDEVAETGVLTGETLHLFVQSAFARNLDTHNLANGSKPSSNNPQSPHLDIALRTRKGTIKPKGDNQADYVRKILQSDISFGVGPAGTGKTYLAVACAVDMLERGEIERILLVRPAVEAGEKLGFLPGDLTQKIDPYLRPLYDALYEMLGFEKVGKLIERQVIEIAPLAYMRGRTLNNSFVILDEAQNTTPEQMKMFLTRLGFGSRAVITGDSSQVDLPRGHKSGLAQALKILSHIKDIHITYFDAKDIVRHHLVQKIVEAYDKFDDEEAKINEQKKQERLAQKEAEQRAEEQKEQERFVSRMQAVLGLNKDNAQGENNA